MKAIIHSKFGPADELRLENVEKPVPRNNEILIKIKASSVTSSDCNIRNLTFAPKWSRPLMRLFALGIFKPRKKRLGLDLAGEVEDAGTNVSRFKKGGYVFGTAGSALGTYAEYICMPEDDVITIMPDKMTWEEAASITLAANTALYFIRDLAAVGAGQKVLINGASGGIGTFAVQLAKYFGAEVTGVCGSTNEEMVTSLGADKVVDYTKSDFTKTGEKYDVIFDVVGKLTFSHSKLSLKKKGIFLTTLPTLATMLQIIIPPLTGDKKVKIGDAVATVRNLEFLKELLDAEKIRPVIDKSFALEQIAEAFVYVEKGHKKGNVVITINNDEYTQD